METIGKIRAFLVGKKTYITAAIGIVTAILAWAEGQISGTACLAACFTAAQTAFLRAGIANEVAKGQP